MRAAHFLLSAQNEPSAERPVHPFVLRVPVQKSAGGQTAKLLLPPDRKYFRAWGKSSYQQNPPNLNPAIF
jgi:hypothetical protein